MGSTRLPGKVMADLSGRTVLEHVLERCGAVVGVSTVCCATTRRGEDDAVAAVADRVGAMVVRGAEHDVLGRYVQAAHAANADVVLRVTSDCPLIDPDICSAVIRLREAANADFATNNMPPSWPHGLDCEVFTRELLDRADREAVAVEDREHVSSFMRRQTSVVNLPCRDAGLRHLRWTLDTAEDLAFLRVLVPRIRPGPAGWTYEAPLAAMRADPYLWAMNEALVDGGIQEKRPG
jgi:spore coat polysaccharide biosynthesis protein SpsF